MPHTGSSGPGNGRAGVFPRLRVSASVTATGQGQPPFLGAPADSAIIAYMRGICQRFLDLLPRFLPGFLSCFTYSTTAEGRSSQSCPGLMPDMTPCCRSH